MNALIDREDFNQADHNVMNKHLLLATLDRWIGFSSDNLMKEVVKMLSLLLNKLNIIS